MIGPNLLLTKDLTEVPWPRFIINTCGYIIYSFSANVEKETNSENIKDYGYSYCQLRIFQFLHVPRKRVILIMDRA